jgi:3-methylfumaryl-CoA hydratase
MGCNATRRCSVDGMGVDGVPEERGDVMVEVQRRTDMLTGGPAEALADLVNATGPDAHGAVLPPLWHWVYLLEHPSRRLLGPEGHPLQGVPSPPGPAWARMFAGGRVTFHQPLRLGQEATKTARVLNVVRKQGRSGPLVFTTVGIEITQEAQIAVTEQQDFVYRPLPPPGGFGEPTNGTSSDERSPPLAAAVQWEFEVDPIVLFRFSALTFNSHRIHYDHPYATAVEGYPDLVVHGPLQALLMAEVARRRGHDIPSFEYRLVAPLTLGEGLVVMLEHTETALNLAVGDAGGRVTARGTTPA